MPSPLTLKRYIAKTKKQIASQKNKLNYSKDLNKQLSAKDEINRLESKLLRLEQQLTFEQAYVQRDRHTERDGRKPSPINQIQECDQMGDVAPW